ncbi:hypothetical protein ADL29_26635 [Streptomyces chattanoogensis]|uniref:DUF4132 domain-containing protein n=2 Tax=Streptomyces chattanoogensis TaxID=66876 RepID=A0A0N0GXY7_9ACTN|nr:hypothetical protein ADL29_26635 [Streptomyces chattanoogensis]
MLMFNGEARMVGSERGSGGAVGAADEDAFVVPEEWRERVHVRPGGIDGPPVEIDTRAAAVIRRRLTKVRDDLDGVLDHSSSNKEMAEAARAHLGGEPDPLGAAVVAAVIWSMSGWDEEKCEGFTDAWAAQHGLLFAAVATAELSRVLVLHRKKKPTFDGWVKVLEDDSSASGFDDIEGAARRTRELLAAAGEAEYQEVVAALADHRLTQYQRVVVSYLVPTREDWGDELVATPLTARYARRSPLLVGALSSGEQLALLRERQSEAWLQIPAVVHTVAEGVGPALVPTLVALLDEDRVPHPGHLNAVYGVLAAMPGDEAFGALAARLGRPGVHGAVLEAKQRFPVRALRLLAGAATGASRRARMAGRLLREHLRAHPALVEDVVPTLSDNARKTIGAAMRAREWVAEATPDALPAVLVDPPWGSGGEAGAVPAAGDEIDVHLLPQVLVRGGRQALPVPAVRHLVGMLAMADPGAAGPAGQASAGIDVVKELCEPASLDEFVWALFRQARQEPAWALAALERLGGDETARELTHLIRTWPRRGHYRKAVTGVEVLAAIGSDVALMHLSGIAQRTRHSSVRKTAWDHLDRLARERGLTAEQFAERLVPGFGLEPNGSLVLDYGRRRFTAGFDEQLRPYVTDEDGKRRKNLPRPGVRDDQVLGPLAHRRFAGLKKDVRVVAADQIRRMERAMVTQHRWSLAEFRAAFADHPLLWHLARRVVWTGEHGDIRRDFRLAEDRTLADVEDETLALPDSATVGIVHPVHLDAVGEWAEVFADYEILQPFAQLERPVHALSDDERNGTELERFHDLTVATGKVLGLEKRGWRRSAPQDGGVQPWISREIPGNRCVVVGLNPGIVVRAPYERPEQAVTHVRISACSDDGRLLPSGAEPRFADIDPVTLSELLTDLIDLTAPTA